jgi:hypothetical protein
MSKRIATHEIDARKAQLVWAIAQIAAIWTVSDAGYYFLLPAFGVAPNYNAGSVAVSLYYGFWIGIAVITFWPLYRTSYIVWSLSFAACIFFAAYVLPSLPAIKWTESWNPPDVRVATASYFLPKSIEILFQQLLVVALVLALSAQRYSIRTISIYCALVFGASHILLAFGGVPWGYVIRFMVSAAAFGFVFPYLILRVPNGLAYSYVIHWAYYAASVVLPHIFSSPVK